MIAIPATTATALKATAPGSRINTAELSWWLDLDENATAFPSPQSQPSYKTTMLSLI